MTAAAIRPKAVTLRDVARMLAEQCPTFHETAATDANALYEHRIRDAATGRLYMTKPLHVVAYPLGHHPGAACRCEACKLIRAYRDYAPGIGRRMLRSSLEEIAAAMTRHRSEPSVEGDYFCQGRVELRNA